MRSSQPPIHGPLVPDDWRELASRGTDGLEISLLWSKSTDRVKVTVADARFDQHFEVHVASADALAAFGHPFAYAPSRSFSSLEVECESLNLRQQV